MDGVPQDGLHIIGRNHIGDRMDRIKLSCMAFAVAGVFALGGCGDLSNREDFAAQLKNKTEPEVLKYAGKPAQVDSTDPNHVAWIYKSRTFDVPTRKTDAETDVIFTASADGKLHVADVVFK
jgi:hypothetical protein